MTKVNLNVLLLGINLALANHFYWINEPYWVIFSLIMSAFNMLTIFLENKEQD